MSRQAPYRPRRRRRGRAFAIGLGACVAALTLLPALAGAARSDREQARKLAGAVNRDLNRILANAEMQLVELAELPAVQAQDSAACNAEMASRLESPPYSNLGAASLDGNLFCLSEPFTPPVSVRDRAYFLRAIGTRDFAVGDFQASRVSGQSQLGIGYPFPDAEGRPNGIVLSPIELEWLDRRIASRRASAAEDVLVIDDHGTVLARDGIQDTSIGTNLGAERLVTAMLRDESGSRTYGAAGSRLRAAWTTVPLSDGAVHVAVGVEPR